ncbi:hypothetical protein F511_21225 [Dorcoceras hygrometricum]|uniref:Uncharacterized protein n=1 Tax=Dorcoceras hygrometricum TaxID=472368 RepID=A0A2Z7BKM6_9LAMI|nr:hypothetical protein F511_21225 [Dorcoceras hygrometricum]
MPQILARYVNAVNKISTRTFNSPILPQQILLRHGIFNYSNCFLTGHGTHNRRNCPGAKSVKPSQYSAQILASTTYCLLSITQIWFYLSQQLLTARTKLKTARNTYPESHTKRRTLYSTVAKTHQLTASSRSLSNFEPSFLTGINRKSYSRRAQRHQSCSKQRRKSTTIYRRGVRMNSNYRGFIGENDEEYRVQNTLSVEQHLVSKRVTNSIENDVAPTNQNVLAQRRIRIPLPGRSGRIQNLHRERSIHKNKCNKTYIGCFSCGTLLASRHLAPTSFTGKLALQRLAVEFSESGPRLESRLLRQSALEEVTNLSRTESPRQGDRNKSDHGKQQAAREEACGGREEEVERGGYLESRVL